MSLSEYNTYRVLEEEWGGRALSEEEWSKLGKGTREHIIGALAARIELTDDEHRELRQARGGCRCQDPGAMPPCSTCTTPLSIEEIETFVLVRRAERQPTSQPEGWGDW
ncbi:hypothetical protein D3C71_1658330 [compost metagenome]